MCFLHVQTRHIQFFLLHIICQVLLAKLFDQSIDTIYDQSNLVPVYTLAHLSTRILHTCRIHGTPWIRCLGNHILPCPIHWRALNLVKYAIYSLSFQGWFERCRDAAVVSVHLLTMINLHPQVQELRPACTRVKYVWPARLYSYMPVVGQNFPLKPAKNTTKNLRRGIACSFCKLRHAWSCTANPLDWERVELKEESENERQYTFHVVAVG